MWSLRVWAYNLKDIVNLLLLNEKGLTSLEHCYEKTHLLIVVMQMLGKYLPTVIGEVKRSPFCRLVWVRARDIDILEDIFKTSYVMMILPPVPKASGNEGIHYPHCLFVKYLEFPRSCPKYVLWISLVIKLMRHYYIIFYRSINLGLVKFNNLPKINIMKNWWGQNLNSNNFMWDSFLLSLAGKEGLKRWWKETHDKGEKKWTGINIRTYLFLDTS